MSERSVKTARHGVDAHAALERLRTWYESDEALAEDLDTTKNTIRATLQKDRAMGEERKKKVWTLYDSIQDRISAADKAAITLVQTMNWIEDEILTSEQRHVIEEKWGRVKRQIQALRDDLTD